MRAEIFRLKGLCHRRLGHDADAHDCFSRSAQVGGGRAAATWLSWSHLLFDTWRCQAEEAAVADQGLGAVTCLLKAVEFDSEPARMLLPRVFWVLEHATAAVGWAEMLEGFVAGALAVPASVWLPHLSALMRLLRGASGEAVLPLVKQLLAAHPQPVLRLLLDRADDESRQRPFVFAALGAETGNKGDGTAGEGSSNPGGVGATVPSATGAADGSDSAVGRAKAMAARHHGPLFVALRRFSVAVEQAATTWTGPLEMALVRLQRLAADRGGVSGSGGRAALAASLRQVGDELAAAAPPLPAGCDVSVLQDLAADLATLAGGGGGGSGDAGGGKKRAWTSPSADAVDDADTDEVVGRLQSWVWRLQQHLGRGAAAAAALRIGNVFEIDDGGAAGGSLEMPAQPTSAAPPALRVAGVGQYVVRICSSRALVQRAGRLLRVLRVLGSDGCVVAYTVDCPWPEFTSSKVKKGAHKASKKEAPEEATVEAAYASAQECVTRVVDAASWALQQHVPARTRVLAVRSPAALSVGRGVSLVREELPGRYVGDGAGGVGVGAAASLLDVYMDHCAGTHDDPTWLQQHARRFVRGDGDGDGDEQARRRRRLQAYREACALVPATLLRQRIVASCASSFTAWLARRELAAQLGLLAAVQLLLGARAAGPDQLVLHPATGTLVAYGLGGDSNDGGDDPRPPFRLTRNLVGALSGALLMGVTTVQAGIAMDAFLAHHDVLEAHLAALLRDAPGPVTRVHDGVAARFAAVQACAPGPQIEGTFDADPTNVQPRPVRLLPVDVHVQELLREAMDEERIAGCGVDWLPWM